MSKQLVWLVTGCSSGFGAQFITSIVARGDKVIATARDTSKLSHLFNTTDLSILQLDVTDSQQVLNHRIAQATALYGRIDVLVNNAAYIQVGTLEDLSIDELRAQFETNVFGVLKVTKAVLPHFRERRSGVNVFMSSLSGWVGHSFCGAYAGSKFALEGRYSFWSAMILISNLFSGLVESLWRETSPFGIQTLLIEPGRFRTKLLSHSNRKTKVSAVDDYTELSHSKTEGLESEDSNQPGDAIKLVEIIIDLVRKEGIAEDREVPFRLPLGIDVFDDIKAKCKCMLTLLKDWRDVIRSTDYSS